MLIKPLMKALVKRPLNALQSRRVRVFKIDGASFKSIKADIQRPCFPFPGTSEVRNSLDVGVYGEDSLVPKIPLKYSAVL